MSSSTQLTTPKREKKISENKEPKVSPFKAQGFRQSVSQRPNYTPVQRGPAPIQFAEPINFSATPVDDDRLTRSSFGRITDIRQRGAPDSTIYDDLINLILNHKKDIKFAPS